MIKLRVATYALLMLTSLTARAGELPLGWTSVRALGMGNAFIAVADNSDAIFYNPAGLCKISGIHWTLFDPRVGINGLDKVQFLQDAMKTADDIAGTLEKLYGKNIWAGGGAKSAFTLPCFGVAAYANSEVGFLASNPANTSINANYYFDYGFTTAGAIPLIPGVWSLGIALRRFNRTGTTSAISVGTLAQMDKDLLTAEFKRRGTAYGLDVGTNFTLPGPVSPTLAVVYRDLGNTMFTHEEGAGAPPRIESELIVGASLEVSVPLISITPAIDYRYVNRPGVAFGKNLNLGVEVALPILSLRGGLHQGYYSAGVGIDLGLIQADVATWGVEIGEYPGQLEDRRYMAQFTFQLGFDPSMFGMGSGGSSGGGSGGGGGERRRLKQRR